MPAATLNLNNFSIFEQNPRYFRTLGRVRFMFTDCDVTRQPIFDKHFFQEIENTNKYFSSRNFYVLPHDSVPVLVVTTFRAMSCNPEIQDGGSQKAAIWQ